MFSALPEPDSAVLTRAPASAVVFTAAIEEERAIRPSDGILWQKLLGQHGFAGRTLQKVKQQTLSVAGRLGQPLLATGGESHDGWQILRDDNVAQAAVYAQSCTLERLAYPGFEAFATEIESVCRAFADLLTPSVRTRVSLRYSNALSTPEATSAEYWEGKVEPAFLFAAGDARLRADVQRTFAMSDFRDDPWGLQIRGAVQPDAVHEGAVAFVFDIECWNGSLAPFSVDSCLEDVGQLNRYARQAFQAVLTRSYYESLKG